MVMLLREDFLEERTGNLPQEPTPAVHLLPFLAPHANSGT